jgi:hypothetical protein
VRLISSALVRGAATLIEPGLDFCKVPNHAARRKVEAARKFAPLLHIVNGCVGKRHDLTQLRPSDYSPNVR